MEGQRGRLTRLAVALVAVSLAGVVTACGPSDATPTRTATSASETPSDTATPTPTPLTEEEAYAAAEATYRAYIDALNAVDLSDPTTFEPLYALTSGRAHDADRVSYEQMHLDGWEVEGASIIETIEPLDVDISSDPHVDLAVCVNVAGVNVFDRSGKSIVGDRPNVQSLRVRAAPKSSASDPWLIEEFEARVGEPLCL